MPKKKSKLKTVLIVIAVIIAIGVIGNLLPKDDSEEVDSNTDNTSTKAPKATIALTEAPTATEIPYTQITSTDLISAYKDNQVKCKQLYDKKLLEITGTVDSIGTDILNQTYVCLGSDTEITIVGIQCYAKNDDEVNKIAELQKGDVITVRGKGSCGSLSFSLEKAEIIE